MTLKKPLILFLFLTVVHSIVSQGLNEKRIDKLDSIIDKSNEAYDNFNYKDALKYGAKLIKKGKKYNDDYYTFVGYDILGGIYSEIDDSVQGRIYSEKALEIARNTELDSLIAWGTLNLGILYSNNAKTYQKAIRLFEESISINSNNNEWDQVYLIYINLVWTYLDREELGKAKKILDKAKSISEEIEEDALDRDYIELLSGRYNLAIKNYPLAKKQLESAAKQADKDSVIDLALEAYHYLAKAHDQTEDYQNAFDNLSAYNVYKKKALTEEKIAQTEKARARFDLKQTKKDLQTALREKEYSEQLVSKSKSLSAILIAATVILFLALLGFYLYFNTRKKYVARLKIKNEELTIAMEKTEKLSKVKTRFLSTVSHELRTPLYGVIGISNLLQQDEKLKDFEDDLESLKFSADYLLALVNDVLLLSKMDAEAITLSQSPFGLELLIENIVKSFEFSLQKNNNELHLDIDENIPASVIGDSVRLSQILINLIGNAVKFNQNGNIWVKLGLVEILDNGLYTIRFIVKDDGPGIPLDQQKIIFKEFSQINHENQNYKGTGLGLTIVKKLLKLHKSKIHLKSSPGEGSEFNFLLKLKKNSDKTEERNLKAVTETDVEERIRGANLRMLIVDDNKINQKITKKILEKYQVESSLAFDGEKAIAMHKSQHYDMILMDINMPKINGMEAAILIRKFDKKVPIIALTAVELDEMRDEILSSGISDIIHKPYDITELLNIIVQYLPR